MKKLVSLLLSLLLVCMLLPNYQVFANDVSGIALEKEMRSMIEQGVMAADGSGNYNPGGKVTRGQFAMYIARAVQLEQGPHRFNDVPVDSVYASGINAAVKAGIISGFTATQFKPDQLITRVEMAIMMNRTLDYLNINKTSASITFTDKAQMNPSSQQAVSYLVGLGIVSGYKNANGAGYSFKPLQHITTAEAAAFIYRTQQLIVQEAQEDALEPVGEPELEPAPASTEGYQVGTVDSKGNVKVSSKTFQTFEEANQAITQVASQVIVYKGKVMKMEKGIVIATPSSATTTMYAAATFRSGDVYAAVPAQSELEYVSSDRDKVTIKVAGQVAYFKHEEVTLLPIQGISERTHYTANANGELVLKIYNHTKKTYVSTTVGKAPANFKVGSKYYSWDGVKFTTELGNVIGTYYQYFNMLPIRTSTSYTAAELDAIIMKKLAEREVLYTANSKTYSRYKDATKKSKLIGLGETLKNFETHHKMNALMVLAWAIHESDYGMSTNAQTKNNLFGIKVYDNSPEKGEQFATPRDSIAALSSQYVNLNYVPTTGKYANGGMPGNKARGMNVRYATDPYWGQVMAGHLYALDQALGGKDFNKYRLYETTTSGLNIRSTPEVSSGNLQFIYPKAGYIVAVLDTTADGGWHQILSDSNEYKEAYVSAQYIKPLTIAE